LIPVLEDEKKEIELHKKRFKRLEKASWKKPLNLN
jgi:hypothetical protein